MTNGVTKIPLYVGKGECSALVTQLHNYLSKHPELILTALAREMQCLPTHVNHAKARWLLLRTRDVMSYI